MAFSLESDSLKVSALILHQQSAALKGPCHCHQQMRRQLRRNHGGELTMPKVCEINEVLLCVACFSLSLLLGVRTTTSNVPRCLSCRTLWLCEPLCTLPQPAACRLRQVQWSSHGVCCMDPPCPLCKFPYDFLLAACSRCSGGWLWT